MGYVLQVILQVHSRRDSVRITADELHPIQWKHLHIATVLLYFAKNKKETVMIAQRTSSYRASHSCSMFSSFKGAKVFQ